METNKEWIDGLKSRAAQRIARMALAYLKISKGQTDVEFSDYVKERIIVAGKTAEHNPNFKTANFTKNFVENYINKGM